MENGFSQRPQGFLFYWLKIASLRMMCSCWLHWVQTTSSHWGNWQLHVNQPGWDWAPPSLRSSFRNSWIAHSRLRVSHCVIWRRISISESCSPVRVKGRLTGRLGLCLLLALYRSVVVKRELSWKEKLSIYQSIYVPTLCQWSWDVGSDGKNDIAISQLRWFGHLVRTSSSWGGVLDMSYWQSALGQRLYYLLERLGDDSMSPIEEVSGEKKVWGSLLRLLPLRPSPR